MQIWYGVTNIHNGQLNVKSFQSKLQTKFFGTQKVKGVIITWKSDMELGLKTWAVFWHTEIVKGTMNSVTPTRAWRQESAGVFGSREEYRWGEQGSAKLLSNGPDNKYFNLWALLCLSQLQLGPLPLQNKAAVNNSKWMSVVVQHEKFICDHWNLKFMYFFHIMKYYSSFDFSPPFKMWKTILSSHSTQKQAANQTRPTSCKLSTCLKSPIIYT